MSVSENWRQLQSKARAAAERAGRDPAAVRILAVSKTFPVDVVRDAYDSGLRTFGENYVQEALAKMDALPDDIEWHMIGHLQSNKARQVAGRFALIHSVDSVHLAAELQKHLGQRNQRQPILVQINVADEDTKSGFSPPEAANAIAEMSQFEHLDIRGLMTIGPVEEKPEDVRWVFVELRCLQEQLRKRFPDLRLRELSMGMTGDFEVAIEEGATIVRVGRAVFGERPAKV
ncbi:MAG: YggS family pyridoxal phosphate-dependent enzyme [Chloroflexi bacterium]|nr:YggS family pyridoxal phosphate-dependent enzyme [Chloroflexota bacterium]